jgi:hypothetical protein
MKGQAVPGALAKREEGAGENDLFNGLAADGLLGLTEIGAVRGPRRRRRRGSGQIQAVPYAPAPIL